MTLCDEVRVEYCQSACCHIKDKEITEAEALTLGDHGAIKREGEWYLRNNPNTGACVYLNPTLGGCGIYDQRPQVCRDYSCVNDTARIEHLIEMVQNADLEHRLSVVDDLRKTATEAYPDLNPDEAFELMFPDLT
ncbi:hypothetical protein COY27_05300 [Candidatus Woesearchaeota archaeon CG_4_10_14_0_2_um_filter_33_13]|nr:MAG: hypothetical protein COY27_05300 [Candidatus Woesearchaeota archaeon CG_4_10_14_0_2_um_filter_33_13]